MRKKPWIVALVLAGLAGCGKPDTLQPGDVLRPQLALAPEPPWPAGGMATLGMLVQVERPGRTGTLYLREEQVPAHGVTMRARVTYFAGDAAVGRPLEVPFVRDC